MSTLTLLGMAMEEPTLRGNDRLILMSLADTMGWVSVPVAAQWCNLTESEVLPIICSMEERGWFCPFEGRLVQPQMWEVANPSYKPPRADRGKTSFNISERRRAAIYERDGHACHYCGATGVDLTLDHKVPQAGGGRHSDDNLFTCCRPCNSSKHTKSYDDFVAWRASRNA
ncbi:MAG: HNH endonuclease [Paracoccaceae bacterium]